MAADFKGWVTKNDIRCSDGRTIRRDAFAHCDGIEVPVVWMHQHDNPSMVLGKMLLENRSEGVYGYGTFNDTDLAKDAKELVRHGDIRNLSIYANHLKQTETGDVLHGFIREVSLVYAGANPGAYIEDVSMAHAEDGEGEAIIDIIHSDMEIGLCETEELSHEDKKEEKEMATETKNEGATLKEVFEGALKKLSEDEQNAVMAVIGLATKAGGDDEDDEAEHADYEGDDYMAYNVFEGSASNEVTLSHDDMATIISDGKRFGSLKESFLEHAGEYGIDNIEYLFPEAREINNPPEFIKRNDDWVDVVMRGVSHKPFSRIKSTFADITEDEARAKGYIKGKMKKEEVFSLLKRSTTPTTIYKKQKLDRDDVVDITDFEVVAWLKTEMRMMLDEELARAFLIGDGRLASDDDHINETNIRPIWKDDKLFTIKYEVKAGATADDTAKAIIKAGIKARKDYKGSGNPTLFTTEDYVTDMLLLEDTTGRRLYNSVNDIATAMRVSNIVTVPVMENIDPRDAEGGKKFDLIGIIVNLKDYSVGADKGGAVNMFDDFDIDYNAMKYLIETRCSGALTKPFSAIALEIEHTAG